MSEIKKRKLSQLTRAETIPLKRSNTVTKREARKIAERVVNKNVEWKYYSVYNNANVTTSGSIVDLSAVPQGDTDITRDGDELTASSLGYRYSWVNGDDNQMCRIIFFQWFPQTTPVVTDIPLTTTGNGIQFMYHTDKAPMYKILYDESEVLNVKFTGGSENGPVHSGKIKIPRKKIQFQAGGTTGSNKVYALLLSDSSVASHPGARLITKLNYKDM